ncbi:MAG: GHKL domain-containing protein [Pedobacter sp.]|nr:MAG: GHKL domain-containing protein [Pedobacter sp.]
MSVNAKIRFLLFVLGCVCILTSLSLNQRNTKEDFLDHEAAQLQKNLAEKEHLILDFLADSSKVESAKYFNMNASNALGFIDEFRPKGINLLVYEGQYLKFWTSSRFSANFKSFKPGFSILETKNGIYEIYKVDFDQYTFVFSINIKTQYSIENQYLKNVIVPELFPIGSLDIAKFSDADTRDIFSLDKNYLFQVKLKESFQGGLYQTLRFWLWIIGLIAICGFVNSIAMWLVRKKSAILGVLCITVFFILLRLSDLEYSWMSQGFNLDLFNPAVYAQSDFLPSLGDFLLNILALTWIILFVFVNNEYLKWPLNLINKTWVAYTYHILVLLLLGFIGFLMEDVFFGLIDNSKINFEITNIVNLTQASMVSIMILCLVWMNVFLLALLLIRGSINLKIGNRDRLGLFLIGLIILILYKLSTDFTIYFIVYALFIFLLSWNILIQKFKFSLGVYAAMLFCMAFLSALKYIRFIDIKERSMRVTIAQKLTQTEDLKVVNSFTSFEHRMANDTTIIGHFKYPSRLQSFQIHNYIIKNYLDGYLSRFEYQIMEFNNLDNNFESSQNSKLSDYKSLIKSGSVKVQNSDYFYRVNDTFGFQKYFGVIPIINNGNWIGTLVIELKSQPFDIYNYFPEVLIDGKLKSDEDYSRYSFAFYKDNKLFSQSGAYTYETITSRFDGKKDKIVFINELEPYFNHAIYKQSDNRVIVISKERMSYVLRLATLSFFFLAFIAFTSLVYACFWLYKNVDNRQAGWFKLNRLLMINANKMLYRTRIQVTIVLAVVCSLLIVGWTTFYYIKDEYRSQQEIQIREKIRKVQLAYERIVSMKGLRNDEAAIFEFNQFADVNASFLNLYDANGDLYLTSLPKIYDYGILGNKMSPKAIINIKSNQRSEFINNAEMLGTFMYAAAYAPIRNAQNQTIAYLGLPFYNNEADFQDKMSLFINTLVNIYALVFVLIGLLAIFIGNQITHPLTFIQEAFKQAKLGHVNQPIIWRRQDEIGSMIKEYNKMLTALEISAVKLARSERESAWREMAKQVAHEIKNPLTPLKLGVQLLEKSWKENDPNFEKKFATFNKSFIEQIDSLANIASEFSNFAKMPDTKLEHLSLLPIIEKAIRVFDTSGKVEITLHNESIIHLFILADKDQLIRSFNNLLKNALEASENQDTAIIKIKVNNDNKYAYVEIQDNGVGIQDDQKEKIFAPNFTTKSSGTGLGLSFVKQAVENAGGSIRFHSITNVGTSFYLSFPLVIEGEEEGI